MTGISRILVVEDQILILLDLLEGLADHGFETLPLYTTEGAAATLLNTRIDALVTDIELPGPISNLELTRQAEKLRPGLPIVVMSGGVRPAPGDLPPGAVFVPKPCTVHQIVSALRRQASMAAA